MRRIFYVLLFILLTSFYAYAVVTEKQYNENLLINKSYQLIMANYYRPLSGADLLNAGLSVLFLECKSDRSYLSKDLNNEEALREFNNIFFELTDKYRGDLHGLSMKIIEGMINSLKDKYSVLLNSKDYEELTDLLGKEQMSGFGFVPAKRDDFVYISSVFPDTPSSKAGLRSGDNIIEINGKNIAEMPLSEIYKLIPSQTGEILSLKIRRCDALHSISIKSEKITLKDFTIEEIDKNVLYIKIYFFASDTGKKIFKELSSLNTGTYRGCIIDLRDNPGGELESSIDFSKIFISDEPVMMMENNRGRKFIYGDNPSHVSLILAILVNNNTMSSAELVASCMQQNNRAYFVGEKTFGKGSIQGLFPLDEHFALKLTVAKFFTPSGEAIDNTGIKPNLEVTGYEEQFRSALDFIKIHIITVDLIIKGKLRSSQ
ncbi:MAG: S41 family peptidase [Candidatus Eremiobacterota bacterium]